MPFFDALGVALTDAEAASRQWEGHPVYDAQGRTSTVSESNVVVDTSGDTEVTLSEDAHAAEA